MKDFIFIAGCYSLMITATVGMILKLVKMKWDSTVQENEIHETNIIKE